MRTFLILSLVLLNVGCGNSKKTTETAIGTTEITCQALAGDNFTELTLKDDRVVCLDLTCDSVECNYGPEEIFHNGLSYSISLDISEDSVEFYRAQEVSTASPPTTQPSPPEDELDLEDRVLTMIDFKKDLNDGMDLTLESGDTTFIKIHILSELEMSDTYDYSLEVISGSGSIRFSGNATSSVKSGYLGLSIKNSVLAGIKTAFIDYKLVATKDGVTIKSAVSKVRNIAMDEIE